MCKIAGGGANLTKPTDIYICIYIYIYIERERESFLEVQTDILNHFWIQVVVSLLKPPHGGFVIETVTNL
jgi:hypothetical protein